MRCEENGYVYIPDGIIPHVPGWVILASCGNTDVLEETIDGKNTFHCTQMMLWQRRSGDDRTVGRTKALRHETIEKLHTLDHANWYETIPCIPLRQQNICRRLVCRE